MIDDLSHPAGALLAVVLLAGPITAVIGWRRPRLAGPAAFVLALAAFAAALWGIAKGGGRVTWEWAPAWRLQLVFELDGLAQLYALLATGIGVAVVFYTTSYLPRHRAHEGLPIEAETRFFALLLLFMGAMVGLVMAQDLLALFIFWDLTAIVSFFLIGYDQHRADARNAAITALLVTGISAACLLIGVSLLARETGSFALAGVIAAAEPGRSLTIAGLLIAVAGLAKSAQAPFHFWLPRAMAAPTPVSAYLHSAAMVAAGVFLLSRCYPLLALSPAVMDCLLIVGFGSIATGGAIALTRDTFKQLLAYSTISQYGYVVAMLGLGGSHGITGASFYVLVHALVKSALFLTAGAITEATGKSGLHDVGGLWRAMPTLAIGSALAAAGLAALPLTAGFFKDELWFAAAHDRGGLAPWLAVLAAAMTVAYTWRFWAGIFLGPRREDARPTPVPVRMVIPVLALGGLALVGGVWPAPFARLAERAAEATGRQAMSLELAYHLDSRESNVMATVAIAVGIALAATRRVWQPWANAMSTASAAVGPRRLFDATWQGLNRLSDSVHWFEVRDLRSRVATILLPAGLLVGIAAIDQGGLAAFDAGPVTWADTPAIAALVVVAAAAIVATVTVSHLALALVVSGAGYGLALVYAVVGAPDVALVAVLIETVLAMLLLGMLALLPRDADPAAVRRADTGRAPRTHRWRDRALGAISGLFALVVSWSVLSRPASLEPVATEQIRLTPVAHGRDAVTVILADFRGLDTLGEITVIGIAFLGVTTLLWREKAR